MTQQRIFITGGTGFIGQVLVNRWLADGHQITVLSRRPEWVQRRWKGQVTAVSGFQQLTGTYDVLMNLAGEGIADGRWSKARKAELYDSRVTLTQDLVRWATLSGQRFKVVLSGSAIGYYGGFDGAHSPELDESAPHGNDFAARLCTDWELAATPLQEISERLIFLRTGVVLDKRGGMLQKLRLPFSLGLGGVIGDGRQVLSWIALEDYCRAVDFLIHSEIRGAVNMTAPSAVTNRNFTYALACAMKRPAFFPMPAFVARAAFGEMSQLLLQGQDVKPVLLVEDGFSFMHPELSAFLNHKMQRR